MAVSIDIGTLNVRTLATSARQLELEEALSKIRCDILGITEARITGNGSFALVKSGLVVFHSGGTSAHRGVAFVVVGSNNTPTPHTAGRRYSHHRCAATWARSTQA